MNELLYLSIKEVLEKMYYMATEKIKANKKSEYNKNGYYNSCNLVTIRYEEAVNKSIKGFIHSMIPTALGMKMTCNILGWDDIDDDNLIIDTMKELNNMILGNYLSNKYPNKSINIYTPLVKRIPLNEKIYNKKWNIIIIDDDYMFIKLRTYDNNRKKS